MFTLRFAFKNIVSRKSSLVIVLFIAFSIGILVMANAVFDGTGNGIEKVFSTSFTGDVVIRPVTDFPMSLFGDETPVTCELSEPPRIVPYKKVIEYAESQSQVQKTCPQLTGQAALKMHGATVSSVVFGVNAEKYLEIMTGITLLEGRPYSENEKAVLLSENVKSTIEEKSGKTVNVGDEIQLISSNGSSYTLRSAVVSGIYRYEVHNDLQDNILLCDPETVRSLLGIESLSTSISIDKIIEEDASKTTWNYIICKLNDGENPVKFVKKANKFFAANEMNVTAITWKAAAGMAAQYVYWMRLIFNIGLLLLIGTGFIVVNNTLIIAAMDRTKETGALRAIGADRHFIATEYLFETLMLTVTAGILGCIIGVIGNNILVNAHITFSNMYLIQLFGGTELKPSVTFSNLLSGMALSLLLAVIGWIYPVHIALDTSPVVAMEHI